MADTKKQQALSETLRIDGRRLVALFPGPVKALRLKEGFHHDRHRHRRSGAPAEHRELVAALSHPASTPLPRTVRALESGE
jgi:hypothetical protein